jgi:4-amino-4-deoxy-L-arabinose transferase-like glycosyltransferase
MWACVAVAVAASWIWSVTTPWLQVPDEVVHVGYVQYLGETGHVPRRLNVTVGLFDLSTELRALRDGVPFSYTGVPTWSPRASDASHRTLDRPLGRRHEVEAGAAANNPPLYYALEAVPYRVAHSANLYDRLLAMRLFSSLLAGLTVAFTYLFLRELLPGTPWTWTVGALGVGLHPLVGFISGGVNPDALLWASCAALFWLIARALRHGLDMRGAVGLGLALAVGLLTKAAMFGLVPGMLLALVVCVLRERGRVRRARLGPAAVALAVGVAPFALWQVAQRLFLKSTPVLGAHAGTHLSVRDGISYVWQVYLPKLPFMNDQFGGAYPLWDSYFKGFLGNFGYGAFGFQGWIPRLALVFAAIVVGLAVRGLWLSRRRLRARLPELACYAALAAGTFVLLGVAGYRFQRLSGLPFEQGRYVLPLLPLYAGLLALAARGAGAAGRYVGVAIVGVAAAHELFAVLLTISHYYA